MAEILKRQDRETNGYSQETPIYDAVKLFNKESKCDAQFADLPSITEDEVFAAIFAVPDLGINEIEQAKQNPILNKILKTKTLPKGSLLIELGGGCVVNEEFGNVAMCSIGRTIYLLLELDKNPRGDLKPYQAFLIRKTFSEVKAKP